MKIYVGIDMAKDKFDYCTGDDVRETMVSAFDQRGWSTFQQYA